MSATTIFSRQRENRQQSRWLLVLFLLSLLAIAVLVHAVSGAVSFFANKGGENWFASEHALLLTGIVFFMVGLGSFFRYLEVRQGGAALAKHYGAVPVPRSGQTRQLRMLYRVTEEMAIASRQAMPSLWVLPRERGVNAFVAGNGDQDLVLVVTQGALDILERDELQAVIGHEMGHIRNGDIPLNMQLLMVMSGLLAVDQIGRILTGNDPGSRFAPLALVGLVLRGLGSAGVLCAGLIRAAFGRQREFFADASAVQFTRQTDGLAVALDKIHQHPQGALLTGYYADEIAHLCFLASESGWRTRKLFSVHPDIIERIRAIDPGFTRRRYRDRPSEPVVINTQKEPGTTGLEQVVGLASPNPAAFGILGENASADISLNGLPDALQIMISGDISAESMLFALLAQQFEADRALFFKAMALKGREKQARYAQNYLATSAGDIALYRIDLIEQAGSQLRLSLEESERQILYALMEKLVLLDRSVNFTEFVLLELIAHKLGVSGKFEAPEEAFSFQQATGLILSLLIEAGGDEETQRNERYQRYARVYGAAQSPQRSAAEQGIVADVKSALFVLENQMPAIRSTFIRHCSEIVMDDDHRTAEEIALLNLLAVTLSTPLPSLS